MLNLSNVYQILISYKIWLCWDFPTLLHIFTCPRWLITPPPLQSPATEILPIPDARLWLQTAHPWLPTLDRPIPDARHLTGRSLTPDTWLRPIPDTRCLTAAHPWCQTPCLQTVLIPDSDNNNGRMMKSVCQVIYDWHKTSTESVCILLDYYNTLC